jgi:hypothetical protein
MRENLGKMSFPKTIETIFLVQSQFPIQLGWVAFLSLSLKSKSQRYNFNHKINNSLSGSVLLAQARKK